MKKCMYVLIAVMMFSSIVAGCGVIGGSKSKKAVKITIAHNQAEKPDGGGWPELDAVSKAYNDESGNTVEWVYVPDADMAQWTQSQFESGNAPDIIWNPGQPATDFYTKEWIVDLKADYEDPSPYTWKPWQEAFVDGVLQGVIVAHSEDVSADASKDAMVGMPVSYTPVNFFYNREIFAAVGLPDEAPRTWSQVLDYARKIHAYDEAIFPFSIQNSVEWNLEWMQYHMMTDLWSDVVPQLDLIDKDGLLDVSEQALGVKAGIIQATDRRMIDYYNFMKEFVAFFTEVYTTASWEYDGLFNEGRSAMQVNGSWYYKQHLDGNYAVRYGEGTIPYLDDVISPQSINKQRKYAIGPLGPDMVVSQQAVDEGRKDAAVDFLRFITDSQTGGKVWIEQLLLMPIIKDVEIPDVLKNAAARIGGDQLPFTTWSVTSFTPAAHYEYLKMFESFLGSNMPAEEFAKNVQQLIEKASEEAIKNHPEWKVEYYLEKVK